ncbi:MAG TPA: GAF domain-containing protein [Acidimicrobiales bacterium]|nr:GAF domain-containing protein [Acidimicrobiales bacterium]
MLEPVAPADGLRGVVEYPTPVPAGSGEEHGPIWDPLVPRDVGGHPLVTDLALAAGWLVAAGFVVAYTEGRSVSPSTTTETVGWLFAAITGVMVAVVIGIGRVARHRIHQGVRDAEEALRSVELVTDPALSFHQLDDLLDELLRRILVVVDGDIATIFLMSENGRELVVRASRGLEELALERLHVPVGEGIIGKVASRAKAVIVRDVRLHADAVPAMRERVASMVAAPLLMGTTVTGVLQVATSRPHRFRERDVRLLQVVADRTAASIERARLDEVARRSRLGAEHARRHLALLARAGEVLSTALESFDEALERLVGVVVPSFADWFCVDLVDDEGHLQRMAAGSAGPGPDATPAGSIPHRHPNGDRIVRKVMTSGRPEVLMHSARIGRPHRGQPAAPGEFSDAAPASGIESMLVVPVRVRGLGFGALSFTTGTGRRGYRRSDLETAQDLAERVSVAVQRVLLWRESREAERTATRHAEQLRRLMEAAFAVNAALEDIEVLRVLTEHARQVLGVAHAAVLVSRDEGAAIEVVAPDEPPPEVEGAAVSAAVMLADVRRLTRSDDDEAVHAFSGEERSGSAGTADGSTPPWLGIPLLGVADGYRRALVAVGSPGRTFSPEDESALELIAQMGSVALENARLYQAVQGNEQRLRAVVESSPLAIAELDLDGVALSWNRAAASLFGWDDVAPGQRRVPEHHDGDPVLPGLWARARQGEAIVGAEVAVQGAGGGDGDGDSGETIVLSVSTAPLRDHLGEVTGILAVIADLTERKRMIDQFNQAERLAAMARLAGGVAHDFNNLLTVILGSSEILQRQLPSDGPAMQEVAAIQRAGERAASLTSELLAIGQRSVTRPTVVELAGVVQGMEPMLRRAVGDRADLVVTDDGGQAVVRVNPAEIERAVLNLVINAGDALEGVGRIEVRTRSVLAAGTGTAEVALSVSDNGCGMDAHTAAHCFEPFFTTKGRAHGTGLGLAAVHAVVTQAGGHLTVDTEPGEGTVFTLWLPAAEGVAEVVAGEEEPLEPGGDALVLVVEDEDELRRLAAGELTRWGYIVLTAADGSEALSVVDSLDRSLDLLVTDVVMPGIDGLELAAKLTTRFPSLPVLYVSGHLDEEGRGNRPFEEDADLLAKPYTPLQLARRVRLALGKGDDGDGSPDTAGEAGRAQGSKR